MTTQTEYFQTIIIGGGQAGLSTGYHLSRRNLPFVILDANARVGDAWRKRWDSLRLFTPARYDGLDGMPFPAPAQSFPTKDQMANYLESYAAKFALPVRSGLKVDRLSRQGDRYVITAGNRQFEAEHVVVAMASFQVAKAPEFARELDPGIIQLHSRDYRNPSQLKNGGVLIVGAGNSGAEIAMDTVRGHHTWVSGRDTGEIPFRIGGLAARLFLQKLIFRFVFHRVLTIKNSLGRKARTKILSKGGPLIRTRAEDLKAAGVERAPRVVGVRDGMPLLQDGRVLDVSNVIWCTGFNPGFSWIHLPVLDESGWPIHDSGMATGEPGLYFIGLPFIYAFSSTMIHGVGRDAERIAHIIDQRTRAAASGESRARDTLAEAASR